MRPDIDSFCVFPESSIREAINCIDLKGEGIAFVVDEERRLLGTVTDGDIRRAVLGGVDLESPVQLLLYQKMNTSHQTPLTATVGTPEAELMRLMTQHALRQIPVLDDDGRIVNLALLHELAKADDLPMVAVVMAGGYGTRLRPLTEDLPKPMLPVGDKPLLEVIINQLRHVGIKRVNLTTHYKSDIISRHFGDGHSFGVDIQYVNEDQPLGTAGALNLLGDCSTEPLLVINGDILTRVDFRAMLDFHHEHGADMTVAVQQHNYRVPYGVVEIEEVAVRGILEKPVLTHFVNAGIYLLNPEVRRYIPAGQPYDMPDLILRLLEEGRRVISFPIREYWLDIGDIEGYARAQADVAAGRFK